MDPVGSTNDISIIQESIRSFHHRLHLKGSTSTGENQVCLVPGQQSSTTPTLTSILYIIKLLYNLQMICACFGLCLISWDSPFQFGWWVPRTKLYYQTSTRDN